MTPTELALEFVGNAAKREQYLKAIGMLRDLSFDNILRRLGEPQDLSLEHPQHITMSAFSHAELRGWYRAVDAMFDFLEVMSADRQQTQSVDFGARQKMRDLGFQETEINEAIKDNTF